jgi:hypothetical protein
MAFVSSGFYEGITQIMPPPRHTYLSHHSEQALIEKEQSKQQFIYSTDQWVAIINKIPKPNKFKTKVIQTKEFFFPDKLCQKRNTALDETELSFTDACHF